MLIFTKERISIRFGNLEAMAYMVYIPFTYSLSELRILALYNYLT
ncbi:hypothetical protein PAECIP112173_05038 [Paenibacillus sp. JJ-100]|nr:hypothetical protein PAECIP112173_05038 [Paenibacillus sp. JJ-100]